MLRTTSQAEAAHHRATSRPGPIATVDGIDLDDSSVWEEQDWGAQGPPQIIQHVKGALQEGEYNPPRDGAGQTPLEAPDQDGLGGQQQQQQPAASSAEATAEHGRVRKGVLRPRHPARGTDPSDYAATGYAA